MTMVQVGEADMEQPEKPVTAEQDAVQADVPSGETLQEGAAAESETIREIESLRAELESWKEKAEFNWDQFLRARADLDNYRKRVERDIAFRVRLGKRDLLLGFLDVLDNLERVVEGLRGPALREPPEGEVLPDGAGQEAASCKTPTGLETFVTGVEMVRRQMEALLQREGVQVVECLGKPFDPATQEAVEAVDGPGESGTVAEVVLKGYTYEGDLLRPARVKVVK